MASPAERAGGAVRTGQTSSMRETCVVSSPLRRFVVADRSMEPTLVAGQGLIGVRTTSARIGQIRCLEHPTRPGFWLVKRVSWVGRHGNTDGNNEGNMDGYMTVSSDNLEVDAVDSRRFGPVRAAGSYLVVVRIPLRWM